MYNIKPCWWGSNLWQTIYAMVAVYPDKPELKEIEAIKMFFTSLKLLLPCNSCKNSYCEFILESDTNINDITNFNSRNNLIKFTFNLRQKVNNKLNHEYGISLEYFKKKLDKMICKDDNDDSHVNNLIEVPFIQQNIENLIINFLNKKTNFNSSHTFEILKISKKFMDNPNFSSNDKYFKLIYKRHNKCRKIISKIHFNMSYNNYDIIESFKKDKDLHIKLFYLGCCIIPANELKNLL